MVDSILQNFTKTKRDVIYMDILMNHIVNQMLKEKWQFTRNTYDNLEENLNKYQHGDKTSLTKNYIINDNETLLQMIYEFKEDLYPIFDSNLFLLLDSFTEIELEKLQKRIKNLFSTYHHFPVLQEVFHIFMIFLLKILQDRVPCGRFPPRPPVRHTENATVQRRCP